MLKKKFILIFFLLTQILKGQDFKKKSFGLCINTPISYAQLPTLISSSPCLFFLIGKHQIYCGTDIYTGGWVYYQSSWIKDYFRNKIYGYQLGYKYFFVKAIKKQLVC